MALIQCEDCGKDVSDSAPACIHCGRPLRESRSDANAELAKAEISKPAERARMFGEDARGQPTTPSFWHDPNVGAVGCLVVIIVLMAIAGAV